MDRLLVVLVPVAILARVILTPPRPQPRLPPPTPAVVVADARTELDLHRAMRLVRFRGYDAMVTQGHLRVLATAPDPANPGTPLRLAEDVFGVITVMHGRVLLARDPAAGDRGRPALVALPVPPTMTDALAAAAWTYNVEPDTYRQLARRT